MASAAVAREIIYSLRHQIAKIEGVLPERLEASGETDPYGLVSRRAGRPVAETFATGAARFDAALGGGLPAAGLIEIHGAATREAGSAAGFALALASMAAARSGQLVWIATGEMVREAGRPYAPGLAQRFGILPQNLLLAETEKLADVLWIAEEAANLPALAGILLEVRGSPHALDLTATRRLHRRALAAGHPLFLLRQTGSAEPTAATVRLVVTPAAAAPRLTLSGPLDGSIGPPAFQVAIDKHRTAPPAAFTLEWNLDACAFEERDHDPAAKNTGALVAAAADGTHLPPALREVVAFPSAGRHPAPHRQPPRGQRPAHRGARRAG